MGRRLPCHLLMVVACACLLSGCEAGTYYRSEIDRTRPVEGPNADTPAARSVTLNGREVDVSVVAFNQATNSVWIDALPIYWRGTNPSYGRLPIWIEVASNDRAFHFDPARVILIGAHGDTLRPERWWGPGIANAACGCGEPKPGTERHLDVPYTERRVRYEKQFRSEHGGKQGRTDSAAVPIDDPTCFYLVFDGRRAGWDFILVPATGAVDADARDLPPIHFKKVLKGWMYAGAPM